MNEMSREEYENATNKAQLYTSGKVIAAQDPPDIGIMERLCDTTRAMNECLRLLSEISVMLFGVQTVQGDMTKMATVMKDAVMTNMTAAGLLMNELRHLADRIGAS